MFAEWARSGRAVVLRASSDAAHSALTGTASVSLSSRGSTLYAGVPGRLKKIRFLT